MKHYFSLISVLVLMSILPLWGQSGKSLVLNGTDQYMSIPSHDDFNIGIDESFTLSLWIKADRYAPLAQAQRFVAKRDMAQVKSPTGGDQVSGYEVWGAVSSTQFFANNAPGPNDMWHDNSLTEFSRVSGSLNTWIHIALVVDRDGGSNGKMYLYQDGQEVADSKTKNVNLWYVKNAYDVLVGAGARGEDIQYLFKGEVDNLRFYKKALSQSEMMADMTSVVDETTDGLVAAYDFENVSGLTVPDISGHGHNGVLHNFPVTGECIVASATVTYDTNFTGRGNLDEPMLKASMIMSGDVAVDCSNVTVKMDGTTEISNVGKVKVYSTGNVNSFDSRKVATYTKLGEADAASGEITIPLTGQLTPGTNYLWVTYDIVDNAAEGNLVSAQILSITTANETYNFQNVAENVGQREILLTRKLLFAPGDDGSKNYRIPAIVTASDGSLVTATDKRKKNQADLPEDIDVLIKRSTDKGKTWSEALTIAAGKGRFNGYGDAGLVRTDDDGGLLCIFVGGIGFFQSTPSSPIRTYVCKSSDNGVTWTEPKDITDQLYGSNCTDNVRKGWYGSFCASGAGLLGRDGTIYFVAAVRETSSEDVNKIANYVYYSKDKGETWQVSACVKPNNGNEAKIVELNDGSLLASIRNQSKGARYYATSTDGGESWSDVGQWTDMIEPGCDGDIIYYTSTIDGYEKNRILHSVPNDAANRVNVSVFVSYDEGKTWPVKKSICPTGSAYSSLAILPDGTIGAYVEENYGTEDYSMYFTNFSLEWLTDGADTYHAPGEVEVVKAPAFSHPEGEYENSVTFELTTETTGASIYYTLDKSTPTEQSTLYDGSITLEETTTVKAIAIKDGLANSEVTTAVYTITHPGEYCVWDEDTYPRGGTDRVVRSLSVTGASLDGSPQSLTTVVAGLNAKTQSKINFDNTADVLNATVGDEVSLEVNFHELFWTHFYLYIDYNQNGVFEQNEIVSYTHYSEDGKNYFDSKGKSVQAGVVAAKLPSFVIPESAKTGETRIRFKSDWNCLDPCGNPTPGENFFSTVRGTICDFTINIHKGKTATVSFEQVEGATLQVMNGEEEVVSGASLQLGTTLTVNATAASDDYVIRAILVNGEAIEGNTFVLTEDAVISLDVVKGKLVEYQVEGEGTLSVTNVMEEEILSGSVVKKGELIGIKATANENYHVESVLINDEDKTAQCTGENAYYYPVNKHTMIHAKFAINTYPLNYSCNEEYGTMVVQTASGATVTSGDMIAHNTKVNFTLRPIGPNYVASVLINGEEKINDILNNNLFSLDITKETTVKVVFEVQKYHLTLANDTPEKGKLTVKRVSDNTELEDGSEIRYEEDLLISWLPVEGCNLEQLWIKEGDDEEFDLVAEGLLEELGGVNEMPYPVYSDLSLRVVFDGLVSVSKTEADAAIVYAKDGKLIVKGANAGSVVYVYDVLGQQVESFVVKNATETVQLGSSSFYLVKIADGESNVVKKVFNR